MRPRSFRQVFGIVLAILPFYLLAGCGPERVRVLGDERAEGARLFIDGTEVGRLGLSQDMRNVPAPPGADRGNLLGFFSVDGRELRMRRSWHDVMAVSDSGETLRTRIFPRGEANALYFEFSSDSAWAMVIPY